MAAAEGGAGGSAAAGGLAWATKLLGPSLLTKDGDAVVTKKTEEALAGVKFVALYFSASWCGPCQKLTPLLSICYEDQADKEVEVVFVSDDSDVDSFNEYFAEMPWTAVPFDASQRPDLGEGFGVSSIPRLVMLSAADGSIVDADARAKVTAKKNFAGVY